MNYNVKVSFRCRSEVKRELERNADALGMTLSNYINVILEERVKEWESIYNGSSKTRTISSDQKDQSQ